MDHDHTGQIIFCGDGQVTFLYIDKNIWTREMVYYGRHANYLCWVNYEINFCIVEFATRGGGGGDFDH